MHALLLNYRDSTIANLRFAERWADQITARPEGIRFCFAKDETEPPQIFFLATAECENPQPREPMEVHGSNRSIMSLDVLGNLEARNGPTCGSIG